MSKMVQMNKYTNSKEHFSEWITRKCKHLNEIRKPIQDMELEFNKETEILKEKLTETMLKIK